MYPLLLSCHIAGGTTALLSAAVALTTAKGDRAHVYSGRAFVIAMSVVFLTAVPMTLIRPNLLLLLVAVFSFYLALSGWLRARNRSGVPVPLEWMAAIAMVVAAVAMGIQGIELVRGGDHMGIVLLAFGGIGAALAASDLWLLRAQAYRGTTRIAWHLARMLGATIAALTAFAVVNIRVEPAFAVWLTPTVILTPLIFYWTARVQRSPGSLRSAKRAV